MDAGVIGVLGTVLGVLIAGPVTYYFSKLLVERTHKNAIDLIERTHANDIALMKVQEFNQAAITFRSRLHSILQGYYPTVQDRSAPDYSKVKETIPIVESIASNFAYSLQGNAMSEFNTAVQEYCRYCETVSKTHDQARAIYDHPSMPNQTGGSEVFNTENLAKHVDNLLSFAKEK